MAITRDSKHLVSGGEDCLIIVWNVETGEAIRTWEAHEDFVVVVLIAPNQELIVSGGHDCRIKVWDLQTGANLRAIDCANQKINSLALTSDLKYIVVGMAAPEI